MAKDVIFANKTREALLKGANTLSDAVKVTLGPKGRLVILSKLRHQPRTTKDGVSVAKEIVLKDEMENAGAQILKEASIKTAEIAGDGTTTSIVLAQMLIKEGFKGVESGRNPMDIKRGMDLATKKVMEFLDKESVKVLSNKDIENVATISANGEEEIGKLISQAVEKIGKEGIISFEETRFLNSSLEVVEGIGFEKGFLSHIFSTNHQKLECEFENCFVLLCDRKISNPRELTKLLDMCLETQSPILIIAEEIDGDALYMLVENKLKNGLKVVAVNAPHGENYKEFLEDIAVVTGATVVKKETQDGLQTAEESILGRARKIIINKNTTKIIDGVGTKEDIKKRCDFIRTQIEESQNPQEIEELKKRLSRLISGVAVISVGGSTEVEMKERRDRVEDAIFATRAAVEQGIVPGGGCALLRSVEALKIVECENDDQMFGVKVVEKALMQPCKQICENAGKNGEVIADKILSNKSFSFGYNAQDDVFLDMFEAGIIDPTKVIKTALENATSVAGLYISTECLVVDIVEDTTVKLPPLTFPM